ncbi:MAG: 50S ribosomal protein L11 methyltransferase [Gammaproteobacteria bacterium]|nr:50S ribosomal protein L11 methyltransferase [Gammaproteobacteria bacterium]
MRSAQVDWQQFVMHLGALRPSQVEDVFTRHGASSVSLTDGGDDPVLEPEAGETPLWAETCITALFPAKSDMEALRSDLRAELGLTKLPPNRVEPLADRVWEREWLKDFGPMRFGRRLWICPSDHDIAAEEAVVVRLDPGLAFGTGTHPTTALCLEWLDGLPLAGKTLLDYGCGSGVLAIAALKLGCRSVTAMDIDPQAVIATQTNAAANDVEERLRITDGAAAIDSTFDVVVANILAGPLIELAEPIASLLAENGMLGLSGVLSEQAAGVMAAYEPWIEFGAAAERRQDGQVWTRLTGSRR